MMLPNGTLITIGNSVILIVTADDTFMRKLEEAPESDSAYFTRCTSRFMLNIVAALADCSSLPSATIFVNIPPLVLNEDC